MVYWHGDVPALPHWRSGRIAAVQRLHADTDREALGIARETVKRHSELSGFELWERGRKVGGEMNKSAGRG
jgi:hypothetical protein